MHLFGEFDRALIERDLLSYNSAMAACASAACWIHVLGLLSTLQVQTLEPNAVTSASVELACRRGANPKSQLTALAALESAGLGTVREEMLQGGVALDG